MLTVSVSETLHYLRVTQMRPFLIIGEVKYLSMYLSMFSIHNATCFLKQTGKNNLQNDGSHCDMAH